MSKCREVIYKNEVGAIVRKIRGVDSGYYINNIYKNEKYNFYWYENNRGYIHILRVVTVKMNGKIQHYSIEDNRLKPNGKLASVFWGIYKTPSEAEYAIIHYLD